MAFDSTADLLFRILTDSSPAQADLAALRASMLGTFGAMIAESKAASAAVLYDWAGRPIKQIGDDLAAAADTTVISGRRMASASQETRLAFRGLGEEVGVHMPRFVASWLSSLGGVSTVMAVAFAPIAAIGLVEVLSKIPTALEKGIDWLHGWTAESKKAFEASAQAALDWQVAVLDVTERFNAIPLIGLEGTDLLHAKMEVNKKDIQDVFALLRRLEQQQRDERKIAGLPAPIPGATEAQRVIVGPEDVAAPPPKKIEPIGTKQGIDQAKIKLKDLDKTIADLQTKLTDLTLQSREIEAETAAAAAKEAKKPLENFTELSRILDQVESKLADTGTAEDKVREQMGHLADEAGQAKTKLEALNAAHKISPEDFASQIAAWQYLTRMVPELQDRMFKEIDAKRSAEIDKQNEEISAKWLAGLVAGVKKEGEALDSLRARLAEFNTRTLAEKHAAVDAEIELMRQGYAKENKDLGDATAAELVYLTQLRAEKHAKIDADAKLAADTELARLGEQLERIEKSHQTAYQRIADQYQADVAKFSAAEEKKAIIAADGAAAQAATAARFAAIRKALYIKEEQDVQALHNSTGWKGVFGADFAKAIRGNEDLSEDWADAEKRSHLLVKVAMEATKEQSMELFSGMTQGMGSAIAQALVYSKSIGGAMRQTAASTLESITAKDMVLALDSLGWGFYDLAMHDYPGAASAFKAAAIFGSVGAAAGVAGRAIAGPQSSSGSSGASGTLPSDTAARQANMQSGAVGVPVAGQGGPHVTVNVYGHVYGTGGMAELASAMNDAVLNSDVTLTATNTKTGAQVTR